MTGADLAKGQFVYDSLGEISLQHTNAHMHRAHFLPVKFKFDWTKRFGVRVWKRDVVGQTNRQKQTNKQNYTNFESNLAMMVIYLSVKFEVNLPF